MLSLFFFADISETTIKQIAAKYGEIVQPRGSLNDVVIKLRKTDIKHLAAQDAVQWIEEVGPPDKDLNDNASAAANAQALWVAPFNLDGSNVQVGQWESGNPDGTHGDLTGRITVVENEGISDHATHVAGTVVGDGSLSAGAGGAANQWRGMADNAGIFSYSTKVDNLEAEEHNGAINDVNKQIDVSTNSWSSGGNDYRARSVKFDRVVRGVYGRPIPVVFSAGNSNNLANSVRQPGGTAKNTITVGNVNSDDLSISIKSSWGPTDENQTKPDIVAPGDEVGGDVGSFSTVANQILDLHDNTMIPDFGPGNAPDGIDDYAYPYGVKTGTSMAAPVVTGAITLMLQQYRETYFGDDTVDDAPLPSSIKAILIHTAEDLIDNPAGGADLIGPDYVYGYGLLNTVAAVDVIRNKRFREGVILTNDDEDIYSFNVVAGEDELKVTLAWDDAAGTAGAADIIQNDLDLVVINPAGTAFYPPWELNPANPTTPAVRDDYATEALSDTHRDDTNVVEQVVIATPAPGTWMIKIKASDLPGDDLMDYQRYSIIAGDQDIDQLEGGVDVMQVLDRSGSMGGTSSSASVDSKIEVLRYASDQFIHMMRTNAGNNVGLVQFNQDVVAFDPAMQADLSHLTDARATLLRDTTIPSIVHGGSTSIGDGLQEAMNQLTGPVADPDHDQIILLVTDGKENMSAWIADVKTDLVANKIPVYPLGLGYGSGINEAKLTELAADTGGTYRITSDELIFRKFFIEVLAGAVDWDVIVDPVDELSPGETVEIPVVLTADQETANFTAYWQGVNNGIELQLVSPGGVVINPSTSNSRIRFGVHPRYAFYQLAFPLQGALAGERAGTWKMRMSGKSQSASANVVTTHPVRYSASAFSSGGAKLSVSYDKLTHKTGANVLVKADLSKNNQPLHNAVMNVYCNVPAVSAGNVLHDTKIDHSIFKNKVDVSGDPVSLTNQKLDLLNKQAGKNVLLRTDASLELYDDGQHSDGAANDGVYANQFTSAIKAGSYTCRIVASNIPAGGGLTTTREWTKSFYTDVDIHPDYSVLDVALISIKENLYNYQVTIAPKDKFGNYMGPGRDVSVNLLVNGASKPISLTDNIDSTYSGHFSLTENQSANAQMDVKVNGQNFATINRLPSLKQWYVSTHFGSSIPMGSFSNNFDPAYHVGIDVGYKYQPALWLVASANYNRFKSSASGSSDFTWQNLLFKAKYELNQNPLRPFVNAGLGIYEPSNGSTKTGLNVGGGVDYWLTNDWAATTGVDYHTIFTSGSNTNFTVIKVGASYYF